MFLLVEMEVVGVFFFLFVWWLAVVFEKKG
jgi:hypothetical protein